MNDNLLKKLIIDEYFGILNRNGFEHVIEHSINKYYIFLLDFNNIKKMNKELGYKKVNEIFKNTFNDMKDKFIIGRAFSGDEIFFCTSEDDAPIWVIPYLTEKCSNNGLSFGYNYCVYDPTKDNLKDKLNELIDNFHK